MPHSNLVQSLIRALGILELVAHSQSGLALREISKALGMKAPTAYNLARTLMAKGYLEKVRHPLRYRLGPMVRDLFHMDWNQSVVEQASAVLRETATLLPTASLTFSEPTGGEVRMVLRIRPERFGIIERPANKYYNAYTSTSSLLFQAYWPDDDRLAYLRKYPFDEMGKMYWKDLAALDVFLEEVRHKGYAAMTTKDGFFAVTAPIFGPGGDISGALGCRLPIGHATKERHAATKIIVENANKLTSHPPE